jgi:hypothetical protein
MPEQLSRQIAALQEGADYGVSCCRASIRSTRACGAGALQRNDDALPVPRILKGRVWRRSRRSSAIGHRCLR